MTDPKAAILVQEEFIQRIDSIASGLDEFKAEFNEFKAQQEQHFDGVKEHLASLDNRMENSEDSVVELADLVRQTLEEVRAIGVAMEVYSIRPDQSENAARP